MFPVSGDQEKVSPLPGRTEEGLHLPQGGPTCSGDTVQTLSPSVLLGSENLKFYFHLPPQNTHFSDPNYNLIYVTSVMTTKIQRPSWFSGKTQTGVGTL